MRRWYVYKEIEGRSRQWVAIPAREKWWERPQGRRFPQWDMAMDYATKMARTERPEDYTRTTSTERLEEVLTALGYRKTTIPEVAGNTEKP